MTTCAYDKSTRVARIIDGLLAREGGYSDNPHDPGGATNFGITERVARRNGYTGDMRRLPVQRARQIYARQYIETPRFDDVFEISAVIAEELIDTGVNCGISVPGRFLQRGLNTFNQQTRLYRDIAVDGQIGENTLAMLEAFIAHRGREGEQVMVRLLDSLQGARYVDLAERNERLETFTYGWFAHRIANTSA